MNIKTKTGIKRFLNNNLRFTHHARQQLTERRPDHPPHDTIIKNITKARGSIVMDEKTELLRFIYHGRRVVDPKTWNIVTYMDPLSETSDRTIENHKKLHKYRQPTLKEVLALINNPYRHE